MPERTEYEHGVFCWVDLSAHDMEAATKWYGDLFGWSCEAQPSHQAGPPYGMFMKKGHTVAGIGQMSDEMKAGGVPPMWNSYVSVDDAAATEKKVLELGGSVVFSTMQVMDAGHLAFFRDPAGAVFAVWQAGQHCGSGLVNEPGTFCWNELICKDVDASKKFYGDLFGWTFADGTESPGNYTEIKVGDAHNGGIMPMQPEWGEMPPYWSVYFSVADIDATVKAVTDTDGKIIVPIMEIKTVGRFCVAQDPQGAMFALIQL